MRGAGGGLYGPRYQVKEWEDVISEEKYSGIVVSVGGHDDDPDSKTTY